MFLALTWTLLTSTASMIASEPLKHPSLQQHNIYRADSGAAVPITKDLASVVDGPIVLGSVDPILLEKARTAATFWNTYAAPPFSTKTFNVYAAPLNGSLIGFIIYPCDSTCNVTVDPSYPGSINTLIHEFAHGLDFPENAQSGTGMIIDSTNHWAPEYIDPDEIMTAHMSATPHVATYTVNALLENNYACDLYHRHCPNNAQCVYTFGTAAPGVCWPRSNLVYRTYDTDGWPIFIWFVFLFGLTMVGCLLATSGSRSEF